MERRSKHLRWMLKALSFRVVSIMVTLIIVFIITGNFAISLGIALIDGVIKTLLFYAHEVIWNKINIGRKKKNGPT